MSFKSLFAIQWAWFSFSLALSRLVAASDTEGSLWAVLRKALLHCPVAWPARLPVSGAAAELAKATSAHWHLTGIGVSACQQSSVTSVPSATLQASCTVYADGNIEVGVERAEQLLRSATEQVKCEQRLPQFSLFAPMGELARAVKGAH